MSTKITIVQSDKSWMESTAVDQLTKTAELPGIIKAVGLPDLHPGKTPVGAAYLTRDMIYPHIVGNDIGCGLTLFSLGLKENKFKIDKVINKLTRLRGLEEIEVGLEDIEFGRKGEMTKLPFKEKLGTIGSGNHFAEFQKVDRVFDKAAFARLNVDSKEVLLLVHSGSRTYGEHILDDSIKRFSCQRGLALGSEGFVSYMEEHQQALDFAQLNRELIACRMTTAMGIKFPERLLESVHNGIFPKQIEGQTCFIHRKGAAPADKGLVVVAGSRGSKSYIVEPVEKLDDYLFSVAHGAGRKWPRVGCKARLTKIYDKRYQRMDDILASNLIFKDKELLYEEAPEAYKKIERVIEDMLEAGMIRLVASLTPLITYKV